MRAVFVRHGQSTGNAGVPCHDLASIELTELGWRQAHEVARAWTDTPTLIVTSPYLRTRQTAEATIRRFHPGGARRRHGIQFGRPRQNAALLAEGRATRDRQRRAGAFRVIGCRLEP